mmetsp:Transcript_133522/g.337158  ORF Transcript_133522/g.337158 Transcript_133522/m.337158 type:complete len:265 (+) Transcript_133522:246-1040(+)
MANSRTPGALGGICWAIIFHVQESPPHTQSDSNWQLVERHTAPRIKCPSGGRKGGAALQVPGEAGAAAAAAPAGIGKEGDVACCGHGRERADRLQPGAAPRRQRGQSVQDLGHVASEDHDVPRFQVDAGLRRDSGTHAWNEDLGAVGPSGLEIRARTQSTPRGPRGGHCIVEVLAVATEGEHDDLHFAGHAKANLIRTQRLHAAGPALLCHRRRLGRVDLRGRLELCDRIDPRLLDDQFGQRLLPIVGWPCILRSLGAGWCKLW